MFSVFAKNTAQAQYFHVSTQQKAPIQCQKRQFGIKSCGLTANNCERAVNGSDLALKAANSQLKAAQLQ